MTKNERARMLNGWFKRPLLGRITAAIVLLTLPVSIPVMATIVFVMETSIVKEVIGPMWEIVRWDDKEW